MKLPITEKEIWLSVLYAILIIPFAVLIDLGLLWVFNNVLLDILNWFNHLKPIWKVVVFIVLGGTFVAFSIGISVFIGSLLSSLIFGKLPLNWFTGVFTGIVFLINIFLGIRQVFYAMPSWKFWYILEFLFLVTFVFYMNYFILPLFNKKIRGDAEVA